MNITYKLTEADLGTIHPLIDEVIARYKDTNAQQFLDRIGVFAHELPRPVRAFLMDFKNQEGPNGYCIITGYPIDEQKIGPTPSHWNRVRLSHKTLEEEVLLLLFGAILGDAVAWTTQQAGYIVHNVLPIKMHEDEQLGTGSKQLLWWHSEDAFHPYRGDYIGMMCLRNPDQVATTLASIDQIQLDEERVALLFEPHYTIYPDQSHVEKNRGVEIPTDDAQKRVLQAAYERIGREPEKVSVLFGDPRSPYMRLDPYFMSPVDDPEAQKALDWLIESIERSLKDVVLQQGEYCFIDNFKAVHGRKPFFARYDGTDRWLARINIARDLRKSRSVRASCNSRAIL